MAVAARYINRELVGVFLVALAVLLLVAIGGRFIGYLQEAAMGRFTGSTALAIIAFRLPEFVQLIAPVALYIGVLMTFSRLHADREMIVLQGAGASSARILLWLGIPVVVIASAVGTLSLFATPIAKQALDAYLDGQRALSQFDTVSPSTFHLGSNRLTYSDRVSDDRRTLHGVFLAESLDQDRRVTVWADSAQQRTDPETGRRSLVLKNGHRYEGHTGSNDYQVLIFEELRQRLDVDGDFDEDLDIAATPTLALQSTLREVAELHWRIAMPVFTVSGALLALGLARVKPRQGRFAKVVPGVLMMLIYYLLLLVNRNALTEAAIPPVLGMWPVHLLFFAIGGILLWRVGRPLKA